MDVPDSFRHHIRTAGLQVTDGVDINTEQAYQLNRFLEAWSTFDAGILSEEGPPFVTYKGCLK